MFWLPHATPPTAQFENTSAAVGGVGTVRLDCLSTNQTTLICGSDFFLAMMSAAPAVYMKQKDASIALTVISRPTRKPGMRANSLLGK